MTTYAASLVADSARAGFTPYEVVLKAAEEGKATVRVSTNFLHIATGSYAPQVIEVQGKFYLAAAIVDQVLGQGAAHEFAKVTLGRRAYCRVTEAMVNQFLNPYVRARPTADQLDRNEQIKAVGYALIDFAR